MPFILFAATLAVFPATLAVPLTVAPPARAKPPAAERNNPLFFLSPTFVAEYLIT